MIVSEGTLDEACLEGIRAYQEKQLQKAQHLFEQVVAVDPSHLRALNALAVIAAEQASYERSLDYIDKVLKINPGFEKAYNTRGTVLVKMGRAAEAEEQFLKAISLNPSFVEAHGNIGEVYLARGQWDAARGCFRSIIAVAPRLHQAWCGEGKALLGKGMVREAIACFQQAADTKPDFAMAYAYLSLGWMGLNEMNQSIAAAASALRLDPDCPTVNGCVGSLSLARGDINDAIARFRKVLDLNPADAVTHSKLLLAMHYSDSYAPGEILTESILWGERHACMPMERPEVPVHSPVRIGYVSADFKDHVIKYFFEHLLEAHDRKRFRVYCYSNVSMPDATTLRLRNLADSWVDIAGMSDKAAAERIADDGIDILIDLSGHTSYNRLQLFALKPAPVQATWLGYPGTTGVRAVDYRISDRIADPEGLTDSFHTEKVVRLDNPFLSYRPEPETPVVTPSPASRGNGVTFGTFNFLAKISPTLIAAWGDILRQLPDARLILKSKWFFVGDTRDRVLRLLENAGVASARVTLLPFSESSWDHLDCYRDIDISLDTFPYNGTTTTFESLWMGVPVVTLAGESHVGRVGASILSHLDLKELVADSREEYVSIAVHLAQDLERLETLRKTLRGRLSGSVLCNCGDFARNMERAFMDMLDKSLTEEGIYPCESRASCKAI